MKHIDRELDRLQAWIDAGRPTCEPGTTWRGVCASAALGFYLTGAFLYVAVVSGALD